jgi:uroporphyrinogen decarboxylase
LLTAVLAGAPAPVCPVFAHQHHPAADQDGERLAEATVAWQARFDFDLADLRRFDRDLNRSQVFLLAKPLM